MLTIGDDLSSYVLSAGEPFLLQVAFEKQDGTASDLSARAFVLSFVKPNRSLAEAIDGDVSSDGSFVRFERDGSFSEALYGQNLQVELAERLLNGRNVIATGGLTVKPTAATVPSLADGPIGDFAIRAVFTDADAVGDLLTFRQSVVPYVAPGSTPTPAPRPTPGPTPTAPMLARATPGLNVQSAKYYNPVPMQNNWGWYVSISGNNIFIPWAGINTRPGQSYDTVDTGGTGTTLSSSNATVTIVSSGPGSRYHQIKVNADETTPVDRYISWSGTQPAQFVVTRGGVTGTIAPEWLAAVSAGGKYVRNLDMGSQNGISETADAPQMDNSVGNVTNDPISVQCTAWAALCAMNGGAYGWWFVIPVDRTPTQLTALFTSIKTVLDAYPGAWCVLEWGNEFWNIAFPGARRVWADAMRKGYYGSATYANLQPALTVTYVPHAGGGNGSAGNTDSPALNAGDLIMYPLNGVGIPIFQAKTAVPAGSEINVNSYFQIAYDHNTVRAATQRYRAAMLDQVITSAAAVLTTTQMANQVFPALMGQQGASILGEIGIEKTFVPGGYARVRMIGYAFYIDDMSTDPTYLTDVTQSTMETAFRAGLATGKAQINSLVTDAAADGKIPACHEGGPNGTYVIATGNSTYLSTYIAYCQSTAGKALIADQATFMRLNFPGPFGFYQAAGDRIPGQNYPYWGLQLHFADTSNGRYIGWNQGLGAT